MSEPNPDHSRFSVLVAFYQNGTLSNEDRIFMDAYISQNPQTQAELKFSQALHDYSAGIVAARAPDAGLTILLAKFHKLNKQKSPLAKLRAWCLDRGLTPAFAVAAVVIAVQAAILLRPAEQSTTYEFASNIDSYRGVQAPSAIAVADLKISPSPDATYANLASLFSANQCQIVYGPDADGSLWLKATANGADIKKVAEALKQSQWIDSVNVVKD